MAEAGEHGEIGKRGPDEEKAAGGRMEFAAAIIANASGKLLLLRRAPGIQRWPGKWGIAGGGIEAGETPEQGLLREFSEELGTDIRLRTLRGPYTLVAIGGYGGRIHLWHMLWQGGEIRLSDEHTEYAWLDCEGYRDIFARGEIMPGVDEDLTHFGIWPERAKRSS